MLTVFAIPKAFEGHTGVIQRNAIRSWLRLGNDVQVILLGDDPGVAEAAAGFGVDHIATIAVNEFGTPLLDSAFSAGQIHARHEVVMYTNADLIFFPELISAIETARARSDRFMLVGQCYDLEVTDELGANGIEALRLRDDGELRGRHWIDYFVFPNHILGELPAFAVGRPWWDKWMIWRARQLRLELIDLTGAVPVVHQRHGYEHVQTSSHTWWGPEGDANRSFLRLGQSLSMRDATHTLAGNEVVRSHHDLRQRVRTELSIHDWSVPLYRGGRWLYHRRPGG